MRAVALAIFLLVMEIELRYGAEDHDNFKQLLALRAVARLSLFACLIMGW